MTLEDFFTLIEMKDGLTAPSRVTELVTVMQKERDCVAKNVSDTTRQWSTVARTIAATENKECLDLFIQLDGLWFIDNWLKDAQKFGNDTGESFVEESITALLRALENLRIDNRKSVSSGIWVTVKNLLGHNSSRVQDRARVLFDSWKQGRDSDDIEKVEALCDDGLSVRENHVGDSELPECSSHDISTSRGNLNEGENVERSVDEMMPSVGADDVQPENMDESQIQTSEKPSDDPSNSVVSSDILKPVNGNHPIKEDSLINSEDTTVIGTDRSADIGELHKDTDDAKQMKNISSSEKLGVMDKSSVSSPMEHTAHPSSADTTNDFESAMEPESKADIDTTDKGPCREISTFADVNTVVSEGKNGVDDGESPKDLESKEENADALQESSSNTVKSVESEDEDREHASSSEESEGDSGNDSDVFKLSAEPKTRDVIYKSSDIDLDYDGIVDPLDIARQVAIEVEREVDCREPSCSSSSSSEKKPDGGIKQPDSPDITSGKQSQSIEGLPKDLPNGSNLSAEALQPIVEEVSIKDETETLGGERENRIHNTPSSQVFVGAREPEAKAEKGFCGFDLNEELCADDIDMDHMNTPVNSISTPISVVSASRAAAATGQPVAPLQFEGTLGWKGPAATSAFRPASPRRIVEPDNKTLFTLGTHNSSKQRQDFFDFDLNVTEGGEDKIADLMAGKQIQNPILSGESSIEASSRRSERLHFDLNHINDGGDVQTDWRRDVRLLPHRNGLQSPSPSSSSSSMQPSLRNIDLNDRPSFLGDTSSDHSFFGKSSLNLNSSGGGFKADDTVISIMGARVEVNRKDFAPRTFPLPNGRTLEPTMDVNMARTGGILGIGSAFPYAHAPIYGAYNGLAPGPTVPFTSAMYGHGGPIPYMVDSRGAHVVPQIMGSTSALPHAFSQPPFMMSMTGPPPGSNGLGPLRHNFDLNSGMIIDGGNRDPRDTGGLRQFLYPGQVRSIDEHLRANAQPSSSTSVGEKRKEPDSGWEPYPFNYKHHQQPPWK